MNNVIFPDFKAKAEKERGAIGRDLVDMTNTGCSSACIDSAKSAELFAAHQSTPFTAPDTDPA